MACFLVPAAEAIVTTVAAKVIKSKEKEETINLSLPDGPVEETANLLWGGSALLFFEHLWHGEIVPFFPFLTAVETGETSEMLAEMCTAGVAMAVLVTAVWALMLAVSSFMEKRALRKSKPAREDT